MDWPITQGTEPTTVLDYVKESSPDADFSGLFGMHHVFEHQ